MYNVIRMYANDRRTRIIKRDQTLEQAQEHCRDPETSSSTCKNNKPGGQWFDGYEEQKD